MTPFKDRLAQQTGGLIRIRGSVYISPTGWTQDGTHICVLLDSEVPVYPEGWTQSVARGEPRFPVRVLIFGAPRTIWVAERDTDFLSRGIAGNRREQEGQR